MTEPKWEHTVKGQRTALIATSDLPAGKYTLLADKLTVGDREFVRGDDVELTADRATVLGAEGSIAPPDSEEAAEAKRSPGTRSADVRP